MIDEGLWQGNTVGKISLGLKLVLLLLRHLYFDIVVHVVESVLSVIDILYSYRFFPEDTLLLRFGLWGICF